MPGGLIGGEGGGSLLCFLPKKTLLNGFKGSISSLILTWQISSAPDFNLLQVIVQDLLLTSLRKVAIPLEDVMFNYSILKMNRLNSF